MDLNEHVKKLMECPFNEKYPILKSEIIKKLCNNTEAAELSLMTFDLMEAFDIIDGKKIIEPITLTDDGVELTYWNDEIVNELLSLLPKSIKKLTISNHLLCNYNEVLSKFPELEELNIKGSGILTKEDINLFRNNNLKIVNCEMNIDRDLCFDKELNIFNRDDKSIINVNDLIITTSNNKFIYGIVYNGTIEDMSKLIKPDSIESRSIIKVYRSGNVVLEYNKTCKTVKIVMLDSIDNTYNFLNQFIKSTSLEYEKIELLCNNKTYDDIDSLNKFKQFGNVLIDYGIVGSTRSNIDEFINMRFYLDYYVSLINQNNLSPAEKLCYAYDLIKSNIYRETNNDKSESRSIHSIVNSGNIVCVGYSRLLAELLKEVGIDAYSFGTIVPISENDNAGHERNIVEIHDDKYNLDGVFALDCTWDSNSNRYNVVRNDEEKLVGSIYPDDKIIHKYDAMSSYRYFLIPYQFYNNYFPGETIDKDIKNLSSIQHFNPNELEVNTINDIKSDSSKNINCKYDESFLSEDLIISLIYNTRLHEGYSKEQNDLLIDEVIKLRKNKKPKELEIDEELNSKQL